jgi:cobalamin biosynthesis Mg chelatase CobN
MKTPLHQFATFQVIAAVTLVIFLFNVLSAGWGQAKLTEAMEIRGLLSLNTEEIRSTLRALNGEFVPPEAGGDLLRDGSGTHHPAYSPSLDQPTFHILGVL